MKKITISLTVISLFLFSCGNTSNEKPKEQTETIIQQDHHHDEETQAIELNNGEKWEVDESMMLHIRNMEKDVEDFNGKTVAEHKTLSEKLKENIDLLTSNCTMEGKAHDELHKWLLPFIDLVDLFSEAKTKQEASDYFKQIKASFATFNQYFQ